MLPILPAILLLLFQGPANIERLALEGRLPAAIQAVQHMDQQRSQAEREAIASLLAASQDPDLARALFTIFNWMDEQVPAPQPRIILARTAPPLDPGPKLTLEEGFQDCRRSRDGPAVG
jgi:hypothetical protein